MFNILTALKGYLAPKTIKQSGAIGFGAKGLSPGVEIGSDPLALYRTDVGKTIPKDKAMMAYNGWVFACVKAIADEMANMRFHMYKVTSDGKQEELFEHELLDLLDSVNERQTGPEFKHQIASHLELTGNAYILLDGVKKDNDKPKTIHILNPANVEILRDKTVFPYTVSGYKYRVDNLKKIFKPYEIVHLKYPDPNDDFEGIGTVQTIASWVDIDNYATEFNRKFFLNGAKIGGFLKSDAVGEAQINSLRLSFESNHGGVENSHKTAVLPKGVEYAPNQETHRDMDFAALMESTRDKILAGFRVSRTILGTAESDTNRATAETADYIFARRTIKPKMELICSYLNEFLTPRYGSDIYISFVDPTPEDKSFRIQEMQATVGNQPVLSLNEAREKYLGAGPVSNGDSVMAPMNMIPIGSPEEETPTPKKSVDKRIVKTKFMKNAEMRKKAADEMAKLVSDEIERIKKIKSKKISELTHEEHEVIHKEFITRVDVYEKKVISKIRELNAEQKKEVLENLPAIYARETKAIKPKDLFNLKGWIQLVSDALTPIMLELYGKEGAAAGEMVGFTGIDLLKDPNTQTAIGKAMDLLSESYNQTTIDTLTEKLNEIISTGATETEATQMVNDIYAFSDISRAASVARTESFRIANGSQKAAWKKTGVVKELKWFTASDDEVCEFCAEQDGITCGIDENFYDQGDEITGSDGGIMTSDYSDIGAPPLHVNCRCGISASKVSLD